MSLGEFAKALPKAPPGRNPELTDSAVCYIESKTQSVQNLGFSPKQMERMEALADIAEYNLYATRQMGTISKALKSTQTDGKTNTQKSLYQVAVVPI